MTECQAHFEETRRLAEQLSPDEVGQWLLTYGYFPEQYVLPPCFSVRRFDLRTEPYFLVKHKKGVQYKPTTSEVQTLSFPRSSLTIRAYGIIEPRIYHDLAWHIAHEWPLVVARLFDPDARIYSYSFPLPVSKRLIGRLSELRAGRMIYEFIEMAENDLVGEAHRYRHLLKTDITNCYASIYTHTVSWALHGKVPARADRFTYDLVGNRIDKLLQSANDGRTNGIPVGPAMCDLISEIVLAAVDLDCTSALAKQGMDFLGVRYKDDYRFLCHTEEDARAIAKTLQKSLIDYNLSLSEGKSEVLRLPEGLFRPWTSAYQHWSLRRSPTIGYRAFESTLLAVLRIDQQYPGTGLVDRFLSELTTRKLKLKLRFSESDSRKAYSLLLLLKQRRAKSFPSILAVVESILNAYPAYKALHEFVSTSLEQLLASAPMATDDNDYDCVWISYFLRVVLGGTVPAPPASGNPFARSVAEGRQCFFPGVPQVQLFEDVTFPPAPDHLLSHLALFHRTAGPQPDKEDGADA